MGQMNAIIQWFNVVLGVSSFARDVSTTIYDEIEAMNNSFIQGGPTTSMDAMRLVGVLFILVFSYYLAYGTTYAIKRMIAAAMIPIYIVVFITWCLVLYTLYSPKLNAKYGAGILEKILNITRS